MSEMVERVAQAILAEDHAMEGMLTAQEAEVFARAAIAAMREPTKEMICEMWLGTRGACDPPTLRYAHRRAIDAALEPARAEAPAE